MNTTTETTPESGKPAETVTDQFSLENNTPKPLRDGPDDAELAKRARDMVKLVGAAFGPASHPSSIEPETVKAPPAETQVAEAVQPPPVVQQQPPPSVNGDIRFYKKVSVQMPLYVDKVRIRFEVLGDNIGVIKLDPHNDARTIEVLNECAKAKRGGVVSIDEETFAALKKNHPFRTSAPRFQPQKLRVWDSKPKRVSPSVSGNVAAVSRNGRPSPVVGGSGGSAVTAVGDVAVAGKSPATFSPNLQRKSGVLKTPASGQFRADANIPPPFPPPKK